MKGMAFAGMMLVVAAGFAATNDVAKVTAVSASTNAPAAKACVARTETRAQCEAITKSGARCKRNAAPGAKLCRQHQKIAETKAK